MYSCHTFTSADFPPSNSRYFDSSIINSSVLYFSSFKSKMRLTSRSAKKLLTLITFIIHTFLHNNQNTSQYFYVESIRISVTYNIIFLVEFPTFLTFHLNIINTKTIFCHTNESLVHYPLIYSKSIINYQHFFVF